MIPRKCLRSTMFESYIQNLYASFHNYKHFEKYLSLSRKKKLIEMKNMMSFAMIESKNWRPILNAEK